MEENKNFMDTLNPKLVKRANKNIKEDLFDDWSFALDNNEIFYGDKEYAERSGINKVRQAFNAFYKLSYGDVDYLD
jgi:hypothetical protein